MANEAKMVSGYSLRVNAARMPGYEPPSMTQGVDLGLKSVPLRVNFSAK